VWRPLLQGVSRSLVPTGQAPGVEVAIVRMTRGSTREQLKALFSTWFGGTQARQARGPRPVVLGSPQLVLPFRGLNTTPGRLLVVLVTGVSVVLFVGLINASGVMLARGVGRQHSSAIQLALGASLSTLGRQYLMEGLLCGIIGSIAGLGLSRLFLVVLLDGAQAALAGATEVGRAASIDAAVDARLFVFILAAGVCAGTFLGLVPLIHVWRADLNRTLAGEPFGSPPSLFRRLRRWVVVPQIAASLALLLLADAAVGAFVRSSVSPLGYDPKGVVLLTLDLPIVPLVAAAPQQGRQLRASYEAACARVLEAAKATPGIEAVAMAENLPTAPSTMDVAVRGRSGAGGPLPVASVSHVSSGYFHLLRIPVIRGRDFDPTEPIGSLHQAIVDETFVARYWPGQDPMGQQVAVYSVSGASLSERMRRHAPEWFEVVGVVGATRSPLSGSGPQPSIYLPLRAVSVFHRTLFVRGRDTALAQALPGVVATADARAGIVQDRTLASIIDGMRYPQRMAAELTGFSAVVGLALAVVGLYGVLEHLVARRKREFGIRMALGAPPWTIARLVVGEALWLALTGAAVGGFGGLAATKIASAYLLPLPAVGLPTMGWTIAALAALVLAVSVPPARLAGRLHPAEVLRRS
jgi:putative ABC transport system permease protein